MSNDDAAWITNYIWSIANDVLRDLYVRGKYRDVILPMTVLRRLDAVLEDTKQAVLDMKAVLDRAGVVEQDRALRAAAGQAFYNTSKFALRDFRARASQQQLRSDFEAYLDGFSPKVQDILENFDFRNQIPRLSKADALGTLIEKLTSPDVNLSPAPVKNADGTVRHPGLDNHGMGSMFEELVRRFNEENNEEAGEHWTPRDAVRHPLQRRQARHAHSAEPGVRGPRHPRRTRDGPAPGAGPSSRPLRNGWSEADHEDLCLRAVPLERSSHGASSFHGRVGVRVETLLLPAQTDGQLELGVHVLVPRSRLDPVGLPVARPTLVSPHFQDHASDNWEPEGAGSDGVVTGPGVADVQIC